MIRFGMDDAIIRLRIGGNTMDRVDPSPGEDESTNAIQNKETNLLAWGLRHSVYKAYRKKGVQHLYEWQVDCLKLPSVLAGKNLVYSAPTSGGKTLVAELLCLKTILERNKKAIFVVPYKSMVQEKKLYFQDLLQKEDIEVGGFTGKHTPHGGLDSVDLAVCVIEKANSLLNRLINDEKLDQLGIVVVDELHQIGDNNRGYLLEDIVSKVLYMNQKCPELKLQIVGMSATLPNIQSLASWLKAEYFTTEFRPVPLYQYCMLNGEMHDTEGKVVDSVKPKFANDESCISSLCSESMQKDESSILVFCMSKAHVEALALKIARDMRCNKMKWKPEVDDIISRLNASPAGFNHKIREMVLGGVGIHHAGLSEEERDIMEDGFRSCILRVLISTSTLCSGVNLPAKQVIIRYGPQLSPLMYRQMAGRAGRTGYDTLGKSYLVVNNTRELRLGLQLMNEKVATISSCMYRVGGLSSALKQVIMEMVASGAASSVDDLVMFMESTLLIAENTNPEHPAQVTELVVNCLQFLLAKEFIRKSNTDGKEKLVPTRLGKACLAASMRPDAALELHQELERSLNHCVLSSDLHLIYLAVPQEGGANPSDIDWLTWLNQFQYLPNEHKVVATVVGVEERFIGAFVASRVNRMAQSTLLNVARHARFRKALALNDLIREHPLDFVARVMGFSRGQLQSIQQAAAMQAGRVTAFCRELGWSHLQVLMENFIPRLTFGVRVELVELLRISLLDGQYARFLFKKGYCSLTDLAIAQVEDIEQVLLDIAPYEASHKKENETVFAQRTRVHHRVVQEYRLKKMAQKIITEARELVQDDIGGTIDWSKMVRKSNTRASVQICPADQEWQEEVLRAQETENQVKPEASSSNVLQGETNKNVESVTVATSPDDAPNSTKTITTSSPCAVECDTLVVSESNEDLELIALLDHIPDIVENRLVLTPEPATPVIALDRSNTSTDNKPEDTKEQPLLIESHEVTNTSSPDIFENESPIQNDQNKTPNVIQSSESSEVLDSSLFCDSALYDVLCQYDRSPLLANTSRTLNNPGEEPVLTNSSKCTSPLIETSDTSGSTSSLSSTNRAVASIEGHSSSNASSSTVPLDNSVMNDSLFEFAFSTSILEHTTPSRVNTSSNLLQNSPLISPASENPEILSLPSQSEDNDIQVFSGDVQEFEIVMLDSTDIFKKFCREWKSKGKLFSLSVACERIEVPIIGANVVGKDAAEIASPQEYDSASEYRNMKLVGVALCWGGLVSYYVDLRNTPGCEVPYRDRMQLLETMLYDKNVNVECYNAKEQLRFLKIWTDISMKGANLYGDPFIASWLLDPEKKTETLNYVVMQHFPELLLLIEHAGTMRGNNSLGMGSLTSTPAQLRAAIESCITFHVCINLHKKINELGLWKIYKEVELPLVRCLVEAEVGGISMDLEEAHQVIEQIQQLIESITKEAHKCSNSNFSLESKRDLTNVLYNKLKLTTTLPNGKKTRTFKIDKQTLLEMGDQHPLPQLIVEYRSLKYILTKILIPLLNETDKTRYSDDDSESSLKLIHPSYSMRSSTGRIYMHEPNLQNIPRDLEVLDQVVKPRNQFKAAPGNILISADYKQIELRMLAHFSQDDALIEVLDSSKDIFKEIAVKALNKEMNEITDDLRQKTKVACYSFIYGKGEEAASYQKQSDDETLNLQLISQQLRTYFAVAFNFLEQIKNECSQIGATVTTLRGRKRWLNKTNSNERNVIAQTQRQAVNTLMQGSAADVVKCAMIRLQCMLEEANLTTTTKLVLHIHDELMIETTKDNQSAVMCILQDAMEYGHNLNVTLPVKLRSGSSWSELKEI